MKQILLLMNSQNLFKKTLCIVIIGLCVYNVSAQEWNWATSHSSSGVDEAPFVATSPSGDVYVVQTYEGAVTVGSDNYPAAEEDGRDLLIAKYNADGVYQWSNTVNSLGGGNNQFAADWAEGITADDSGVYVIGSHGSASDFFGESRENYEFFIAKLSADGDLIWDVSTEDAGIIHQYNQIEFSSSDKLLVSGLYDTVGDEVVIGGQSIGDGGFLLEVNSTTGEVLRAADEIPFRIDQLVSYTDDLAAVSSYYEGAHHVGMVNLNTGLLDWNFESTDLTNDPRSRSLGMFVNDSDEIEYVFKAGTSSDLDFGNGMVIDGGNNDHGLLMRLDSDGNAVYTSRLFEQFEQPQNFQDTLAIFQLPFTPRKAIKDGEGGFYLTGTLIGPRTLANGLVLTTDEGFNATSAKDAIVMRLDSDFTISEFASHTGTAVQDGYDIASSLDGDIVMAGVHTASVFGPVTFNTAFGETELSLTSDGLFDVFVTRLSTGEITNEDDPNSILESKSGYSIIAYPNPTSNGIFQFTEKLDGISIHNQTGQLVFESHDKLERLDLSGLKSGIYFASAKNQHFKLVLK